MAVLLALLVLDRVSALLADRSLSRELQRTQHLAQLPSVSIRGFPFVTQVLRGRYEQVDLSAAGVQSDGVRISHATIHLFGVSVRTGDVLAGRVRAVPVTRGTGTADLSYADLNSLLHRFGGGLGALGTVSGDGPGRFRITGPAGLTLNAGVTVDSRGIRVVPDRAQLDALPPFLSGAVTDALSSPLPLPSLPFGARLRSGTVDDRGLRLQLSADHVILPTS